MSTRRQGGWVCANSHLVTFRYQAVYRTPDDRLVIAPGTQLVGMLLDGPEPALRLDAMTLALSPQMVEIAPNPDPDLTMYALAQRTEQAARAALEAGDVGRAADGLLQASAQRRLLGDIDSADDLLVSARQAHNAFLRSPAGIANFDTHTGDLSDEALRQLGATIRLALRQLGGYQYTPATPDEAFAAWEIIRHAMVQVANFDHGYREHPRPAQPITPQTMWLNAEYLAGELIAEPQGPPERLLALAQLALALDPDEADGYAMIGRQAASQGDLPGARRWYEAGVRAGERRLGAEIFSDPDRPRFWLAVETRPYMRARAALADTLQRLGEVEQAVAEYWGLLELNPGDNQGLRYILASLLLERRDHDGFARLYRFIATPLEDEGYDEGEEDEGDERAPSPPIDPLDPAALSVYESAYWLYPAALYHFQREGDSERARAVLATARKENAHVISLLLGRRALPREDPDGYTHGGFDEAVLYARIGRAAWQQTPGALEWLRGKPAAQPKTKAAPKPARPQGKQTANDESLRDLLGEWVLDGATYQTAQTKKVYRTTITRLLDWLEIRGLPLVGAALTPEQVNAFLDSSEAARRGAARNSIRVWCEWLEQRKVIAKNPLPLGGG